MPLTNCWALKFKVPPKFLDRPPVVEKPLVTLRVCPVATWMIASEVPVAPKEITGMLKEEVAPDEVPVAKIAPVVRVRVVGLRPVKPPIVGEFPTKGPLLKVNALRVWLPVSEFDVAVVALNVCVAVALKTLVAAA